MKTLSKLYTAALTLTVLLAGTSAIYAQTKGSGNVQKQVREVQRFTEIKAGSAFEVILSQADQLKVTVETDDNFLENIRTDVNGNRLVISSDGMRNPTAMKVYVEIPALTMLSAEGAAKFISEGSLKTESLMLDVSGAAKMNLTLDAQSVKSDISGAAKVDLSGKAATQNADVSGAALFNALKMSTESVNIEVSGAAKAKIYAVNVIQAEVSGAGSLIYYDNGDLKKISQTGDYTLKLQNPAEIDKETELSVNVGADSDSTLINIGDIQVQVVEGKPTKVKIGNNELEVDDDGNVDFKRNRADRFDGHWGGVEFGVNGYLNNSMKVDMPDGYDFMDLRYEKSMMFALNFFEQNFNIISNKFGLTTGLGLEWKNYRFNNNAVIDATDGMLTGYMYEGDKRYTKSKLVVTHLTLPLILEFQTNRFAKKNSFHIGGGVISGLRIGSHTKMVYDDGQKQKEKYRDDSGFGMRPFKFDLTGRIGWGKVNLFANYSLNSLFKDNKGPELYPFSAGITLAGW